MNSDDSPFDDSLDIVPATTAEPIDPLDIKPLEPQLKIEEQEASASVPSRHKLQCVNCKTSLRRKRSHNVNIDTERERLIRSVIIHLINPNELRESDKICHPCWQRADRLANRCVKEMNKEEVPVDPKASILLPNLRRASDTQGQCFVPGCTSQERLTIPRWLRVHIFEKYNYYIPLRCRICQFHLHNDHFNVLENHTESIQYFTASHIQDFSTFVKDRKLFLDFKNMEQMPEDLIRYWTGLSKEMFFKLKADLPNIKTLPNGSLALAAFLIKLNTGESNERLSTLLNVPRTTLTRYLSKVKDIMPQDFVPTKLGINKISKNKTDE